MFHFITPFSVSKNVLPFFSFPFQRNGQKVWFSTEIAISKLLKYFWTWSQLIHFIPMIERYWTKKISKKNLKFKSKVILITSILYVNKNLILSILT